ncbi:hypothetical protein GGF41_000908, partial [Coemansia sp. RSA 2531]
LMLNLVEALSECSSASDDEQEKGVLGDLNVAAAFDLSAYAPSDIARYQANTRRLQKAMRAELKLFIAEEECASDIEDGEPKQQETPTKTKKDVKPKPKKGGKAKRDGAN